MKYLNHNSMQDFKQTFERSLSGVSLFSFQINYLVRLEV